MPAWKLDLNFAALKQGWQETYYADFGLPSFDGMLAVATKLADLRIALCANPVVITSYSISDPLTDGQQGETVDFRPVKAAASVAEGAGDPATSVNVVFRNATEKRKRRIFMRGVPDSVVTDFGQLASVAWGLWHNKFLALRDYLLGIVNGQAGGIVYGWLARKRVAVDPSPVSYAYAVGETNPVFTTNADFFTTDDVGKKRYVRVSGLNGGQSPLNGQLIVRVITRSTFTLLKPIAAFPQSSPGIVRRYATLPEFVAATNVGVERSGTRRPGAPFLQRRGHARAKPRG